MKSKKPVFKSFRKKIAHKSGVDALQPNIRHGETLVPIGSTPTVVSLPETKQTFTYDIINTDRLTSDLTLATTEGSLRGLILNTDGGTLNVTPVASGTKQLKFESTIKDGSYISTLSDGADWFIWSIGTGVGLGQSTTKRQRNAPPSTGLIGKSIGSIFQSVVPAPVYADLIVTRVDVTVDYPSGPAEHDLVFHGSAEPNSTIKIFDSVPTQVGTVSVASDGAWSFSVNDLANGQHEYEFKAFVGGSEINKNDFWSNLLNGGSLEFECAEIQIEVGTSGPDFTVLPTITDPNGVSITPTVNSTTYSDSLTEDQTFNVVFDFVYDSVTYQRTVQGVVVNLIQPAVPAITSVGGNASGVAISATTANIVGTAEIGATVEVWIDGVPNIPIATVTADGSGDWSISSYDFGFTMNQTVIIKAQQQTAGGSLWSNATNDFLVVYEQNVLSEPTITSLVADLTTFSSGDYANKSNPFTINGTGIAGSEITLNGATALGGTITVAGDGTWTTTTNLSHDATHDITAQATKAGFTSSQQSTAFQLNVDRTAPSFGTINDITLFLGNVTDSLPTANDSFDPNGVTVTPSYSPSLASVEGDYVATYTATDRAGNSTTATDARTITVTTEPIVPVITSITANSDGTFTVAGTVTGTYADNLTIQVTIDDSNSGSAVNVIGEAFTHTTSAQPPGTYEFKAKSINSVSQESSLSSAVSETGGASDTTAPVMTITNTDTGLDLTDGDTVSILDGGTFNFTATTDDGSPVVVAQGGSPVTSGVTTFAAGTYSVTFDSTDGTNAASTITINLEVVATGVFLEELSSAVSNLASGAVISSGIFDKGSATGTTHIDMESDGIIQFSGVNPVNTDFTLSFWFRPDDNFGNGFNYVMGKYASGNEPNSEFRIAMAKHPAGFIQFKPYIGGMGQNTPSAVGFNSFAIGNWYHVAMTYKYNSSSSKYEFRTYLDGVPGGNKLDLTYSILNTFKSSREFGIGRTRSSGGGSFIGTSPACSLDSIQFGDGIVLDDYQIQQIYNQSNRLMSIAEAQALTDPSPGSNSPTTFIEDNDDVISRNPGKINTLTGEYRDLDGTGNNSGLQVLLDTDGVIQYSAGQPLNDEFTISWWMKPDAVQAKNTIGVLGYSVSNNRMLTLRINNGTSGLTSPKYELRGGTPNQGMQQATYNGANNGNIGDGNWHHFAIQCASTGTALITKLFVDGNDLGIGSNFLNRNPFVPTGFKMLPPSSNESFYFGSAPDLNNSGNNGSITAQFDSMQMGVVLTNSQIAAIAAQSDRKMSIATASGLP